MENPIARESQKTLTHRGPLMVNKKGTKIRAMRQRLIIPEHDQSRVTQCKVYEGIGETIVCHRSVKIARIDTTNEIALTGGGIPRKMFTMIANDAKTNSSTMTVANGMGLKLMGISKVGPFAILLEMNSL
jgi:hypothetical protein